MQKVLKPDGYTFVSFDYPSTQQPISEFAAQLQNLILSFLKEDDPPAMFIMDSMGTMLKLIERLEIFSEESVLAWLGLGPDVLES